VTLARALGLPEPVQRQFPSPQPATVLEALPDGRLIVEPDTQPGVEWGPAPWGPRPASGAVPPVGTRCLVLQAGAGVQSPWVVALDWRDPGAAA
jgi:hypothetical protein